MCGIGKFHLCGHQGHKSKECPRNPAVLNGRLPDSYPILSDTEIFFPFDGLYTSLLQLLKRNAASLIALYLIQYPDLYNCRRQNTFYTLNVQIWMTLHLIRKSQNKRSREFMLKLEGTCFMIMNHS
ncbi:hypothetical protein NPIL_413761 [Nephila pilipes]|uniref:CCHC-type domain-containing protein n=1 Tax=Nephila pilipes TaxID=299642 RepID=A0A8X6PP93_NEPPI|nr:hypothetical protein NPIL_413761 [Nephila pilipes]